MLALIPWSGLLICIVTSVLFTPVYANFDIPLRYENGELHNLPAEFAPAGFNNETKTLKISGKFLKLPDAVKHLFPDNLDDGEAGEEKRDEDLQRYKLEFYASWLHGPSLTPPYMVIKIMPQDENFHFNIYIDMERVSVMNAMAEITSKNNQTFSIPILTDAKENNLPEDWHSIVGVWRAGDVIIKISEDRIETTIKGAMDYPNGLIKAVSPGIMMLITSSGKDEKFLFAVKGDILELSFLRAPKVGLARLGSDADKVWRKRLETSQPKE